MTFFLLFFNNIWLKLLSKWFMNSPALRKKCIESARASFFTTLDALFLPFDLESPNLDINANLSNEPYLFQLLPKLVTSPRMDVWWSGRLSSNSKVRANYNTESH